MNDRELDGVLTTALECAREAGRVLARKQAEGFAVSTKSAPHDLVTSADVESERVIVEGIRARWPSHDIEGEEGKYARRGAPYRWVIDPIDGTANFSRGLPFYSVSIGVVRDEVPVVGVVYDPSRNELFWATAGGGAHLNGRTLAVARGQEIRGALLATGFHYERGPAMVRTLEAVRRFLESGVMEIRRIGSAALELSYVAAGRLDGMWEHRLMSWDVAAGVLLVREAGGRVTDLEGRERRIEEGYTVASSGAFHDEMLAMIRGA